MDAGSDVGDRAKMDLQKQKLENMTALDGNLKRLALATAEMRTRFEKESELLKAPAQSVMSGWRNVSRLMTVRGSEHY